MAAHDARAVEPQPSEHVAAEPFGEAEPFRRSTRGGDRDRDGAVRQARQYLVDQSETLLDLANAYPDACIDIARGQHRHLELNLVIGRIGERLARIEGTTAGAADVTAGAELAH